jgi:hypothetical protein
MELSTRLWRPRQTDFVLSREEDFSGRDSSQAEWHQVQRAKFPSGRQRVLGGQDKKTRRDNDGRSRGPELPMRGANLLLMVYRLLEEMNTKSCNPLKPGTKKLGAQRL